MSKICEEQKHHTKKNIINRIYLVCVTSHTHLDHLLFTHSDHNTSLPVQIHASDYGLELKKGGEGLLAVPSNN